jgi:sigma-B regulation protein RsbU (phosphoserine phosphatase)
LKNDILEQAEYILQELPCGFATFDPAGTLTFANRTLCQLLGSSCDVVQGKNIESILTVASRIFYQTHFFPLLNLKEEVSEIFMTLKSDGGAHVPVMVNAKMSIRNGQAVYTCVFTPVWERQKYEEQLLAAKKEQQKALEENVVLNALKAELETNQHELDRKLSVLRERNDEYLQMGKVFMHDMQEPVRKISLFCDALFAKGWAASNEDQQKIDVIQRSIQRLRHMTSSLLDFVQVSSSREQVQLLNLSEIILQASQEVAGNIPSEQVKIDTGDLVDFEGRPLQIRKVFVELIKNALQNRAPDRPLTIQVTSVFTQENTYQHHADKYKYTNHVQIEVTDNGSGFDSKYNVYVFGLFNKIDARAAGAGLGLALCKQIISNHYGTIRAQSELGKGTCITIVLPVQQSIE